MPKICRHAGTLFLTLAAFCLVPAQAEGQSISPYSTPPSSLGGLRFTLDVTSVPTIEGESTVEIGYSVIYDELDFLKHEDGYRARFEITAILYDSEGRQVAGDSWTRGVRAETYEETNSRTQAVREILRVGVDAGSYRLKVEILSLDSRKRGLVERHLEVGLPTPGHVVLGTVEFETKDRSAPAGAVEFVPNPSKQYGQESPIARVTVPAYADIGLAYALEFSVVTLDNLTQMTMRDTVVQSAWTSIHTQQFSVLDLEVGDYLLRVAATPEASDGAVVESRFRVLTSPRSWGDDFEKMITQIGYVATREELSALKSAEVDEREAAWEEFWKKRDPDPSTEYNEFREEFLRRLGYVNTQFTGLIEGWQTDMGRTYIQYGEPDDVETTPSGAASHAWEVWYYYRHHKKFTFVDRHGFGDFTLVEVERI